LETTEKTVGVQEGDLGIVPIIGSTARAATVVKQTEDDPQADAIGLLEESPRPMSNLRMCSFKIVRMLS